MLWQRLCRLLYPPKCIFCRSLLQPEQTDLCPHCRKTLPFAHEPVQRAPYSRRTIAVFLYGGLVREAILRYKFHGRRQYADGFGRLLAMEVCKAYDGAFDLVTHVPISRARRRKRGYDQAQLLAQATAAALGREAKTVLRKIRNVPAQSGIHDAARRRANVLGVYQICAPEAVQGKRILLIDDVMTTGATLSECCKTLLDVGAQEVLCAVLATAQHKEQDSR